MAEHPHASASTEKRSTLPPSPQVAEMDRTEQRRRMEEEWVRYVQHWFPDLLIHTHFIPPVYMYRTRQEPRQVEGVEVGIKAPPFDTQQKGTGKMLQQSDVKEDQAQQHVLHNLSKLAQTWTVPKEVMLVISQMQFADYLNDPEFGAGTTGLFCKPEDLKAQNKNHGSFDVLIIHRIYGLMVAEIKSIEEKVPDSKLLQRLQRAATQLAKNEDVLRHVTSDMAHSPRIRKMLILPRISVKRLQQVVSADPRIAKKLCQCLGVEKAEDVADHCLCSDHMSDSTTPHAVDDHVLRHLTAWWERCMCRSGSDPAMSDDLYQLLVARFVGPATTVHVHCVTEPRLQLRTKGETISEVGRRLTTLSLYPQQLYLLHSAGHRIFLNGPPGTGKTTLLQLKGLQWLKEGLTVHVVSTVFQSLAASHLVYHQLFNTLDSADLQSRLHFHSFSLFDNNTTKEAVVTLTTAARGGTLCILADESGAGNCFEALCTQLYESRDIQELRIWAAAMELKSRADCLTPEALTCPLRCPPSVTREVEKSQLIRAKKIPPYTADASPMPCDGPEVIRLWHSPQDHRAGAEGREGQGGGEGGPRGQEGTKLMDCYQCGLAVGQALKKLDVGNPDTASSGNVPLSYRDVFVLAWFGEPHDEITDRQGNVKAASGFVCGLREADLPVRVLAGNDDKGVEEVATMTGTDAIVVTDVINVWGLERKVVVWLGDGFWDDIAGRLQAMSRSTAQLIWVAIQK